MKRVLNFLRSMPFANALLVGVALCCGLSSLLPQGKELPYYAETYPRAYLFIYRTHLYDVFKSWYFLLLVALLCLSMLVCTASMLLRALRASKGEAARAAALSNTEELDAAGLEKLRLYMASIRCKEEKIGGAYVFHKNGFGRWGTFLIHLSILLTVIFGAMALYLPKVTDQGCRPGEAITLEDGAQIAVDSFSMYNEQGQLDYSSVIRITLPDGRSAGPQEIRVNYPMTFGPYKVFQWTYGAEGLVSARSLTDGTEERFTLDKGDRLSVGEDDYLDYHGLYEATPENGEAGGYVFYEVRVVSGGDYREPEELCPGDTLKLGGYEFRFLDPYYPGLRIKTMPVRAANALLEAAFVLMLVGLFICFYLQPVLVKADVTGYVVAGPRGEKMRLELKHRLAREEEERT